MKTLFPKQKGFSLIEMIFYVTVLVMMLALILSVITSIVKSERLVRSTRNIDTSAIAFFERLSREVRSMDSIDVASSTLTTHPGRLSLDGETATGTPRMVEFYISGGRVVMSENGVVVGPLTSADVTVNSLIFTRFATSTVEGVRTALTLSSGTSTSYHTDNFFLSVLLR